jgi:3-deoxy-D-manno-octulosonic-acid transferase
MNPFGLGSKLALRAYSLLWALLSPAMLAYLFYRGLRQPAYRKHCLERFALSLPNFKLAQGDLIWVHAVSLGETSAASTILSAIAQHYPGHRLLLTHGTPTGRQAGADLLNALGFENDRSLQLYLPYDNGWAMNRFFDRYCPKIGIIIETEVWPSMMYQAKRHDTKMMLVSARLSEKSLRKAMRSKLLITPALLGFNDILCQTPQDLARIKQVAPDSTCKVGGNLKFDVTLAENLLQRGKAWREQACAWPDGSGGRSLARAWIVAASTREGEESLLIEQWLRLDGEARRKFVLVLVPRHPQRFDDVAEELERRCKDLWIRRSDPLFPASDPMLEIVLGDSLGEMPAWYALADVVVMGGSLIDTGSQNLIEACAAGKPVILGPSIYNFEQAAQQAIAKGAAFQSESSAILSHALGLAQDRKRCLSMGQQAKHFVAAHQGATKRVMANLETLLHPNGS